MSTPTLEQAYEIEMWISQAAVAFLAANGITAYKFEDTQTVETPYVAVGVSGVSGMGVYVPLADGALTEQKFNANLFLNIVTNRQKNGTAHDVTIGRLRALMSRGNYQQNNPLNSFLLYHKIVMAKPQASDQHIVDDRNQDWTSLSFALVIGIHPGLLSTLTPTDSPVPAAPAS
jgi:hypothetical protein